MDYLKLIALAIVFAIISYILLGKTFGSISVAIIVGFSYGKILNWITTPEVRLIKKVNDEKEPISDIN